MFAELGIKDIKSLLRQDEGAEYLWVFPSNPTVNDQPKVAIRRLEGRLMENLLCRTKKYGATVNDFLCTAYLRCLADQTVFMEPLKKEKGAICFTVDLRQYLPDLTTGTVCNFSGSEVIAIDLQKGERFEATLVKVKKAIDEIKIKQPGLSSAAMMELIAEAPLPAAKEDVYRQKQTLTDGMNTVMPYLTNMGIVSEKPLVFGAAEADDGYMIGPITYAPFFCMGVSTYNGVLTLSIGFHTPAVSEREVNRVLDIMMRELGC